MQMWPILINKVPKNVTEKGNILTIQPGMQSIDRNRLISWREISRFK